MAALSRGQLTDLAMAAGFGDQSAIAAAVAMAESSGNPDSVNNVLCYGLWQINMRGNLGTDRRKKLGLTSDRQLLDPKTNARAAKLVYDEQGWDGWDTYKSGAYKQFMPNSGGGLQGLNTPLPGGVSGALDVTGGDEQLGAEVGTGDSPIDRLSDLLRQGVLTTLIYSAALIAVLVGLIILARRPIGTVVSVAAGTSPQGLARKGVKRVVKDVAK